MAFARAAGILLHPTSLPGPGGIGDLGPGAERFLESLARARQSIWQVLPLGPPAWGDSPYQCLSALAGNFRLVSPERLLEEGLLDHSDLASAPDTPPDRVDFRAATTWRRGLLEKAFAAFRAGRGAADLEERFHAFLEREKPWIHDWALFAALKEATGGAAWMDWPEEIRRRDEAAIEAAWREHYDVAERHRFVQFLFFSQWDALHARARELGVDLLGDLPIFVSGDSADVWANPELFDLDEAGRPRTVAGVPPDYFSETGQLWGNPLYRWDVHAERGWSWWIERLRASLRLADRIRIDHFRAFQDYWVIPAGEETALNGRWVDGPGDDFFGAVRHALGELPIVAEDLGELSPGVHELRDRWGLPGMRILQFAFGPEPRDDWHAPHTYVSNCVVYTGTHDNDTTVGWFRGEGGSTQSRAERRAQRARALRYLGTDGSEIHWDFIRLAHASVADTAIVPMPDVLGLGGEARMNVPGRGDGNWSWRMTPGQWTEELVDRLGDLTEVTGRAPAEPTPSGES
jgi:4-alpha-glucanotransferase